MDQASDKRIRTQQLNTSLVPEENLWKRTFACF